MKKTFIFLFFVTGFSSEVSALSSKQLIMFETVREHLIQKREAMIDSMCVNPTYGKIDVYYANEAKIGYRKALKKTRDECFKEISKSCRKAKREDFICETLNKANRYEKAYAFYNEKIAEHIVDVSKSKMLTLCNPKDIREQDGVWRDECGRKFVPTKNIKPISPGEVRKMTLIMNMPNLNREPAQAPIRVNPKPANRRGEGFNKPDLPKPIIFDPCGFKHCHETGIEGFR